MEYPKVVKVVTQDIYLPPVIKIEDKIFKVK